MGMPNKRAPAGTTFFLDAPNAIPEEHFLFYCMHAIKPEKREAFAQLLAQDNGGANCIMPSASTGSLDISKILANRKAAIDAELAIPGTVYGQRIYHKKAQYM